MDFRELKSIEYGITHNATFHADDVFSAAFLKIINPNIKILRVDTVPNDIKGIVFDIGFGEFDHHQIDNEVRDNGIPYASFGKLWRKYAPYLYDKEIVENIDKSFIQNLDLSDNTGSFNELSYVVQILNPTWGEESNGDKEFDEAVELAIIILKKLINNELSTLKANKLVMKAYNNSEDKRIIVLDKHYPYKDILVDTEAVYVIYPSKRGGYAAQGVPIDTNTITLKKDFPKSWVENKPDYIKFIHNSLFIITTNTLDEAIKACKKALGDK